MNVLFVTSPSVSVGPAQSEVGWLVAGTLLESFEIPEEIADRALRGGAADDPLPGQPTEGARNR